MTTIRKLTAMMLTAMMLFALATSAQAAGGILTRDDFAAQQTGEAPEGIVPGSSINYHLNNTIGVPTGTCGMSEGDYFVCYNVYEGLVKATNWDLRQPRPAAAESLWKYISDTIAEIITREQSKIVLEEPTE